MNETNAPNPFAQQSAAPPQTRRSSLLLWVVGLMGVMVAICCGGTMMIGYIGVKGPETSVYTGAQVPASFQAIAKEVGALEEGEKIRFFYSDAWADIRDGFYFVSDRKVVVYTEVDSDTPLTIVEFEEIEDIELYRNESFFEDSVITIELKDDNWVSFPVSSELDRDEHFYDAIRKRTDSN
jgi:hypothetical protein